VEEALLALKAEDSYYQVGLLSLSGFLIYFKPPEQDELSVAKTGQ
jgi:hypothetical protein